MSPSKPRRGSSLIDLLISMAILMLLFGAIFLTYYSILGGGTNTEGRSEAASILNGQIEVLRNLPYDQIGTQGGIPPGVIPATQTVNMGPHSYTVKTTIRNIDDPFDGTLGGSPADLYPADYKQVQFEISCVNCQNFHAFNLVTTFAPKNLESASSSGSLFVNVFDAAGRPLSGATVRVVNSSTVPGIDLTDLTNASGTLQLIGVPSSTQNYRVYVSKASYSSDRTYPVGGAGNPNPVKPDATVASGAITNLSFAIDGVSTLQVLTSDAFCSPVSAVNLALAGSKLIGTSPDVLKYPTTTATTDAQGTKTFTGMEWDTYSLTASKTGYDLLGMSPLTPFLLNPSSSLNLRAILLPANGSSLEVAVRDGGTGLPIPAATVALSGPGVSRTRTTGRFAFTETDWSAGGYTAKSGGLDAAAPGSLALLANSSGTYPGTDQWLESRTVDFGDAATTLYDWSWAGNEPPQTGPHPIKFQFAANNDNSTWNYLGPDGTAGSYYDASPAALSQFSGKRYLRYKVFLSTNNTDYTPRLDSVSLDFSGVCVPPAQVLFQNLPDQTYDLSVSAAGYSAATSSVAVSGAQKTVIYLNP